MDLLDLGPSVPNAPIQKDNLFEIAEMPVQADNLKEWKACLPGCVTQGTLYSNPAITMQMQSRQYLTQLILSFEGLQQHEINLQVINTEGVLIREPLPWQ